MYKQMHNKQNKTCSPRTIIDNVANNSLFLCCLYAIHLCTCLPFWTFSPVFIPGVRRQVLHTVTVASDHPYNVTYMVNTKPDFEVYCLLFHCLLFHIFIFTRSCFSVFGNFSRWTSTGSHSKSLYWDCSPRAPTRWTDSKYITCTTQLFCMWCETEIAVYWADNGSV